MGFLTNVLEFLKDILSEPALLIGLIAFIGLVALRKPFHKVLTGTLGPYSRLYYAECWCILYCCQS